MSARLPTHPAPHVGMAGRDTHPNPGRKRDHRAASALMIADANSLGAVAPIRMRMSRPSSISTAGADAVNRSFGSGATTTAANPGAALRSSFRQRQICPGTTSRRRATAQTEAPDRKSFRNDRPLLLRTPPSPPLRPRQKFNSAHRNLSRIGAATVFALRQRDRISPMPARRPLSDGYD